MDNNVFIKLTATEIIDGQEETFEINVHGQLEKKNEITKICYSEDLEGLGIEETEITIDKDSVLIFRKGALNCEMLIRQGERNTTFYDTSLGKLTIGIYGKKVSFSEDNGKFHLILSYSLDFNNDYFSEKHLDFIIEEK